MDLLEQIARWISEGPGAFFYHLFLLLILAAAFGLAWVEWRRQRDRAIRAMGIGLGIMLGARLLLLGAAFLSSSGLIPHRVLLPPVERMADTVSIALVGWAFLPAGHPRRAPWSAVLLSGMALPLLASPVLVLLWQGDVSLQPSLSYADTWQANLWSIWQVVYLVVVGLATWPGRAARGARYVYSLLIALAVLAAGRIAQLVLPAAVPHIATWERLSNVVAYPILLLAVYQSIVTEMQDYSRELEEIRQASLEQIKSLLALFDVSRAITMSLDLDAIVESATEGIVRVLKADQCAIAFPEESDPNQMRLSAIHNPDRRGKGEAVTFPLDYQLAVRQALRRRKPVVLETALDNVQLKVLYALLGSREIGPLLVQPLVKGDTMVGAMIVGNGRSKRSFTPSDLQVCESFASWVAQAIVNARAYRSVQLQLELARQELKDYQMGSAEAQQTLIQRATRSEHHQGEFDRLRRRFEEIQEERNALEVQFASTRAETDRLRSLLSDRESELVQANANLDAQSRWHKAEIARLQEENQALQQELGDLRGLFESFTIGVIQTDAKGTIQAANPAAATLVGRPGASLQDQLARSLVPDGRWQVALQKAQRGQSNRVIVAMAGRQVLVNIITLPTAAEEDAVAQAAGGLMILLQEVSEESPSRAPRKADAWVTRDMRPPVSDAVRSSAAGRSGDQEGK